MSFSGLTTLEELNLQLGEYAVCMAKRNPFSSYYPMVIRKVKNGYICPALETYITDISGGFRIPDPTKGEVEGSDYKNCAGKAHSIRGGITSKERK